MGMSDLAAKLRAANAPALRIDWEEEEHAEIEEIANARHAQEAAADFGPEPESLAPGEDSDVQDAIMRDLDTLAMAPTSPTLPNLADFAPEPVQVGLSAKAELVDVTIHRWTGRKSDAETTARMARTAGADENKAGRWTKFLIDPAALDAVDKAANRVDAYSRSMTMCWRDGGIRLLPAAMHSEYKAEMNRLIGEYDHQVTLFLSQYAAKIDDAKATLASTFNERDYPTPNMLRAKFGITFLFDSVPTAGNFLVDVGAEEIERIRQSIEEAAQRTLAKMREDLADELRKTVAAMAEKLPEYQPAKIVRGKVVVKAAGTFHDSLVNNVRAKVRKLDVYNLAGDPDIAAIAAEAERELTAHDAETLRNDPTAREDTARKAAAILAKMESIF